MASQTDDARRPVVTGMGIVSPLGMDVLCLAAGCVLNLPPLLTRYCARLQLANAVISLMS